MKKFFKKEPVKVILSILIALTVVFSACNLYFGAVAREEQKGVAVCDEWSTKDKYTDDYAQKLEIGDKDAKILLLTDIHIRNHGTFAACLGVNYFVLFASS
ncbi:MAG: hypothetical protein Q4D20_11045 [Clostridia bacterium]|nr:hypothetical protein [Clostridia bacterium]